MFPGQPFPPSRNSRRVRAAAIALGSTDQRRNPKKGKKKNWRKTTRGIPGLQQEVRCPNPSWFQPLNGQALCQKLGGTGAPQRETWWCRPFFFLRSRACFPPKSRDGRPPNTTILNDKRAPFALPTLLAPSRTGAFARETACLFCTGILCDDQKKNPKN